jgi:hypothetical protein
MRVADGIAFVGLKRCATPIEKFHPREPIIA